MLMDVYNYTPQVMAGQLDWRPLASWTARCEFELVILTWFHGDSGPQHQRMPGMHPAIQDTIREHYQFIERNGIYFYLSSPNRPGKEMRGS